MMSASDDVLERIVGILIVMFVLDVPELDGKLCLFGPEPVAEVPAG